MARIVIKYAAREAFLIDKILVSNMQDNTKHLMGILVEELNNEVDYSCCCLLVCVLEELQDEIYEVINGYTFDKIFYVSDKVCDALIYKIGDYEVDECYAIKSLARKVDELFRFVEKRLYLEEKKLWECVMEKHLIQENWGNVVNEVGFSDKYLKLIRGLDVESIETVTRIITRQEKYLKENTNKLNLFTQKEQEELKRLDDDFFSLIIKLSDNLYMYKNYLLPCRHFEASVFFYKHGIDKIKNADSLQGKVLFDVGGYIGDSLLILEELKPGKIITFEAVPEHLELLKRTIDLNGLSNVDVVEKALGSRQETAVMNLYGSGSTIANRKGIEFEGAIKVPVITLDQYVSEQDIDDIGLIKVDIEGMEEEFLKGAKNTIEHYKPVLLISIYHNAHDFFELKPMLEEWNLGYKFSIYKPTNGNITNETLLIAEMA